MERSEVHTKMTKVQYNPHYFMANSVLGKSLSSDWFFLGQDFAVRTVSMETANPCIFVLEQSQQIQNLQPKQ